MVKAVPRPEAKELHTEVGERLASAGQRYTDGRRRLVNALAESERPLSVFDILELVPDVPQSSVYRHLTVLATCGVAHRIAATDDLGFFELSDAMSGKHHHHVMCGSCGTVADVASSPKLERALADAAGLAAGDTGFRIDAHRIDLVGTCSNCIDK